jgi:hypothetical protein
MIATTMIMVLATPTGALADQASRHFELVSTGDHFGGDATGPLATAAFARIQEADDDSVRAIFLSQARLDGDQSGGTGNVIMGSTRGTDAWSVAGLSSKAAAGFTATGSLVGLSDQLRQLVFADSSPVDPNDPVTNGKTNVFLRRIDGSFLRLSHGTNLVGADANRTYVGATFTGEPTVYFRSTDSLVDGMPIHGSATTPWLYEATEGGLVLVGGRPDGTVDSYGAVLGNGTALQNAVSPDGSRVIFESPAPAVGAPASDPVRVYVRIHDSDGMHTVQASKSLNPSGVPTNPPSAATFLAASPDASKVVFSTQEQLTADDLDRVTDLYEYDAGTGQLARVTGSLSGATTRITAVLAVANSGRVYFSATGSQLAGQGSPTLPNLYTYDPVTSAVAFIGTAFNASENFTGTQPITTARISADGNSLLLLSKARLVPTYNNNSQAELYLYSAASGVISCVSCTPSGAPPAGAASFTPPVQGVNSASMRTNSPLTTDGQTVFFMTPEPLVPSDVNGKGDVYEYHDGSVSLVTTGRSTSDSYFLDATPTGSDVLVATRDSLTSDDLDGPLTNDPDGGLYDVYDARAGSAFPVKPPPPSPCEGDACRGALSSEPILPLPFSTQINRGSSGIAPAPTFSVDKPTKSAIRSATRTGRLRLTVRASGPGSLAIKATAVLRGRAVTVARVPESAVGRSITTHSLMFSRKSRAEVKRRGRLDVRISLTYSTVAVARTLSVILSSKKVTK